MWQYAGLVVSDACLSGNGCGRGRMVTCKHHHPNAKLMQLLDGCLAGWFQTVGQAGKCYHPFAGNQPDEAFRPLFCLLSLGLQGRRGGNVQLFQQSAIACIVDFSLAAPLHTPAGEAFKVGYHTTFRIAPLLDKCLG